MRHVSSAFYTLMVFAFLASFVMSLKPLTERKAQASLIAAAAKAPSATPRKTARRARPRPQLAAPVAR